MRSILALLLVPTALLSAGELRDTSYWRHSLVTGLTGTQMSYTHWAQGGENSVAWTATVDGKSVYEVREWLWTSSYSFAYGTTKLGTQGTRKTDDKIDMTTECKYKVGVYINPFVALGIKTQFAQGYNYDAQGKAILISDFFDPGFVVQSAGVGYQPIPELRTRVGIALREIVTKTFPNYSDDPTTHRVENVKIEGGLESTTDINATLDQNLLLKARLELFSPYKHPGIIVVHGDATISAKVAKYVTTNLSVQVVHEKPISVYTQVKQTIALGLSYSVF